MARHVGILLVANGKGDSSTNDKRQENVACVTCRIRGGSTRSAIKQLLGALETQSGLSFNVSIENGSGIAAGILPDYKLMKKGAGVSKSPAPQKWH